jgi:sterol desaturase/sphingolipid hydroxylase (fatty acid hydroxylase superfamily)
VAWLARRPGPIRKAVLTSAAVATVMGVVAIVVGFFYNVVLRFLWNAVSALEWQPAAEFWQSHPVVGAAATFVAWDLTGWLYHVIGHRTKIGWAAHRPHHSGTEYDSTLGLRQTWAPFHGLVIHPLLALWGFDLETVVVCAAISNSWQILEHTSVPIRFPKWFAAVVMTPAAHRHHHGLEGGLVNLGPFFTWWDRLSGTWVPAEVPAPALYGLTTSPTNNPLRIELEGWLELVSNRRESSRRRAGAPGYV